MPRKDKSNIRTITRRVGFRSVALVTADDSDPAKLAGKDGSGMYRKVSAFSIEACRVNPWLVQFQSRAIVR